MELHHFVEQSCLYCKASGISNHKTLTVYLAVTKKPCLGPVCSPNAAATEAQCFQPNTILKTLHSKAYHFPADEEFRLCVALSVCSFMLVFIRVGWGNELVSCLLSMENTLLLISGCGWYRYCLMSICFFDPLWTDDPVWPYKTALVKTIFHVKDLVLHQIWIYCGFYYVLSVLYFSHDVFGQAMPCFHEVFEVEVYGFHVQ